MEFYVLATEEEALKLEADISRLGNCPVVMKTSAQSTDRWHVPRRRIDNKWVVKRPPLELRNAVAAEARSSFQNSHSYVIEEYDHAWFLVAEDS